MHTKIFFIDKVVNYSLDLFESMYDIISKKNDYEIFFLGRKENDFRTLPKRKIKNLKTIWAYGDYLMKVINYVKVHNPNIVHFTFELKTYGPLISLIKFPILLFLIKSRGTKIILTLYNIFVYRENSKWRVLPYTMYNIPGFVWKVFAFIFVKSICNLSYQIVVAGHSTRDALIEFYGVDKDKIKVIPVGVSEKLNSTNYEKQKKFQNLFNGKKVILCFGVISPRKGQETAIKAFAKIAESLSDHILVITGSAPREYKTHEKKLHELIETLNLKDKVIFTGFVEDDEIGVLFDLAELTLFVYQPMSDGTYAITFSMQYAKPAIVTNTETFNDIFIYRIDQFIDKCSE